MITIFPSKYELQKFKAKSEPNINGYTNIAFTRNKSFMMNAKLTYGDQLSYSFRGENYLGFIKCMELILIIYGRERRRRRELERSVEDNGPCKTRFRPSPFRLDTACIQSHTWDQI
eukprot:TRINITY_DN3586_c0_g1_i4.p1 TRINITY_DN3586_c0_g1~~TRINITY_DN3586_c0_g1_i4.p1  ORF type:complete len:116 (+),score=5.73 TRINITY_DN3586_c0_g1_i4:1110-1457(+)